MRLFAATLAFVLAGLGVFVGYARGAPERKLAELESGHRIEPLDLVFQDLACGLRCDLIRQITQSHYSHVGIVLEDNGERVVCTLPRAAGSDPAARASRLPLTRKGTQSEVVGA